MFHFRPNERITVTFISINENSGPSLSLILTSTYSVSQNLSVINIKSSVQTVNMPLLISQTLISEIIYD